MTPPPDLQSWTGCSYFTLGVVGERQQQGVEGFGPGVYH